MASVNPLVALPAVLPVSAVKKYYILPDAAGTLDVQSILPGGVNQFIASAGSGRSYVLPSKVALFAALGGDADNIATGQAWEAIIYNPSGQTLTLTNSTGGTISGTATIATALAAVYLVTITNTADATFTFTRVGTWTLGA